MSYCICIVPVSPIRSEPSHRSEQVSQLLFGEAAECLEEQNDFIKIKSLYDGYEGWVQYSQIETVSAEQLPNENNLLAGEWVNEITINNASMKIPFGSLLTVGDNGKGMIGKHSILYSGSVINPAETTCSHESIERLCYTFLNTSYQWGGRSVFGIDCSGFTQIVFKCLNKKLLRDASQQARQGEAIGFLEEMACGDLAFFDNVEGKITHVGILLSQNSIIHASGKVRVDTIDNMGIVNRETGKRTHKLRVIKRID